MSKRVRPKVHVNIGKLFVVNVIRDVVHQRGKATVAVREISAEGVGGDVINTKTKAKRRARKALSPVARKALRHTLVGVGSLGASVAAAGVAYALGWA